MHILIVENFTRAHKKLLQTEHDISWITEVDRLQNLKGFFRKVGVGKEASIDEWIDWALAINKIKKIDLVINFHEHYQKETALISSALGLEYIHSLETIEAVNNKNIMRERLKEANIEDVKNCLIKNEEELNNFLGEVDGPVIVKPISGRGSMDINKIESDLNLSEMKYQFPLYAEEFLEGDEYSVEAFSQNGNHYVIAVTQKYKDDINFIEYGHCIPANIKNEINTIIESYVKRVLDVLGIQSGCTHTELILTKDGPRMVETHLRIAGDEIEELIHIAFGIDMLQAWIDSLISNNYKLPHLQFKRFAAIYYKHNNKKGVIKQINEPMRNGNIYKVQHLKGVGDKVEPTTNSFNRTAYVIATGERYDEAVESAKNYIDEINYIVSDNNEV